MLALLCLITIPLTLTACNNGDGKKETDSQSYVTAGNRQLPVSVVSAAELIVKDDTAYICVRKDDGSMGASASYIAEMTLEQGGFKQLTEDPGDSCELRDFVITSKNDIWSVAEKLSESFCLMQFDSNGALKQTVELSDVMGNTAAVSSDTYIYINLDADENIYVTVSGAPSHVYVFDGQGQYLYSLQGAGNPLAVTTAEGEVAVCDRTYGGGLVTVDAEKRDWSSETVDVKTVTGVFGGKSHSFYVFDSSDLYGYDLKTGKQEFIFNWSDLGLSTGDCHLSELEDGTFAILNGSESQDGSFSYELTMVEPGKDDRTPLTMVSLSASPAIVQAVSDFNKNSAEYKVELTEYFPYAQDVSDEDWNTAITNLNMSIVSGNTPDIIDMSGLPVEIYNSKGILEDLNPYIEKDPEINREDYFENILSAISIDGKLPWLTNGVYLQTMAANSDIVNEESAWTYDAMKSLLTEYGYNSIANISGESLITVVLQTSDRFVDWSSGECYFDQEDFIQLLELAGTVQDTVPLFAGSQDMEGAKVASYEPIMHVYRIANIMNEYNGNVSFVGLPNDEGVFHAVSPETKIGIASSSQYKDGAWSFVRTFLQDKQQKSCYFLPIRRESFDSVMQSAVEGNSIWALNYDVKVTQEDADVLKKLLSSASCTAAADQTLESIILEEASEYFAGAKKSAQETASAIQNRAKLYIAEQK